MKSSTGVNNSVYKFILEFSAFGVYSYTSRKNINFLPWQISCWKRVLCICLFVFFISGYSLFSSQDPTIAPSKKYTVQVKSSVGKRMWLESMLSAPDNNGTLVQFQKVIFKTYQKIGSTSECNIIRLDYQPLFRKGACASPLPYYVPPLLERTQNLDNITKRTLTLRGNLGGGTLIFLFSLERFLTTLEWIAQLTQ